VLDAVATQTAAKKIKEDLEYDEDDAQSEHEKRNSLGKRRRGKSWIETACGERTDRCMERVQQSVTSVSIRSVSSRATQRALVSSNARTTG
jgi:hypothetical protein